MEVLFVLLVIALVLSFALPAFRAVRYDVYNSRAKDALAKLAEARRSFYQFNKGVDIKSQGGEDISYFMASSARTYASQACSNLAASGIPSNSHPDAPVSQLFSCGFLDWHDFEGLPYTFYICDMNQALGFEPCNATGRYAGARGNGESAGSKYSTAANYSMYVSSTMKVTDTLD